jgi:hypothetical protein
MGLSGDERELLTTLRDECDHRATHGASWWVRPMDLGGHDGSNHSYILSKLVKKGFADARQRGALVQSRGSKEYTISRAGRHVLEQ